MLNNLLSFDGYKANTKRNIALIKTLKHNSFTEVPSNLQISHLIDKVQQKISIDKLATSGDAFLWHSILLLLSDAPNNPSIEMQKEYVLIHMFDNFFQHLPDTTEITIKTNSAFFPKLNIFLETSASNYFKITKLNNQQCAIDTGNATKIVVPYKNTKVSGKINIVDSDNAKTVSVLFKNFLPAQEIQRICSLTKSLHNKISNSLKVIEAVDPDLFLNIQNNINYLIPLYLQDDKIRTSFSTTELNGSIFISDGGTLMDFCEALIHEFYHNELNILLQFTPLFIKGQNNLYYSPWRTDLRPIGGLFHAIYVFVGVVIFYNKVLKERLYHDDIRQQFESIMKKINIAFYQIKDEDLTETGKNLLTKLYALFINLVRSENVDISANTETIKVMTKHSGKIKHSLPECLLDTALPNYKELYY